MQTVLSLDVDYFVSPKVTWHEEGTRPDDADHEVRTLHEVERFLRDRCLLSTERPVIGVAATDHDAAYRTIQAWLVGGILQAPFRLLHVDAHADLGLGDAGYVEILEDVIRRPLQQRAAGHCKLDLGNWLAYAIANRWIGEVIFLREPDPGRDPEILACYFCNSPDWSVLQMRPLTRGELQNLNHTTRHQYAIIPTTEPEVKWTQLGEASFVLDRPPELVFTCLSPEYSPPRADLIFELVKRFIRQDGHEQLNSGRDSPLDNGRGSARLELTT